MICYCSQKAAPTLVKECYLCCKISNFLTWTLLFGGFTRMVGAHLLQWNKDLTWANLFLWTSVTFSFVIQECKVYKNPPFNWKYRKFWLITTISDQETESLGDPGLKCAQCLFHRRCMSLFEAGVPMPQDIRHGQKKRGKQWNVAHGYLLLWNIPYVLFRVLFYFRLISGSSMIT